MAMAGELERRVQGMHVARVRVRALARSRVVISACASVCALAAAAVSGVPSAAGASSADRTLSADAAASSVGAAAGARWTWPVLPTVLERPFEAPATAYAAGHRGIDLRAPAGTVVAVPAQATVRFVGVVVDRPVLTLDHGAGVLSSYEPVLSELTVGDTVAAGGRLGVVTSGGHCDGVCLHVGVRVDGEYVSPLLFFESVPRAVLLPMTRG